MSNEVKTWIQEFKEEEANVQYCPYCGEPRNDKIGCCSENHWILFSELVEEEQQMIAEAEYESNLYRSRK